MAFRDFINTTTRHHRKKKVSDVVYDKRGFMKALRAKGKIRTGLGGVDVVVPLRTGIIGDAAATSVGTWDGGNQALTYAQDDTIEGMTFNWKYLFVYTFIVDNEKVKNKGKERAISIVEERVESSRLRMSRLLEEQWVYTGDGTGTEIDGIVTFMNNTDATYGGGLDLTDSLLGPIIIAIGAPMANLTLDHVNEGFTRTQDHDDSINCIIGPPSFLQQMRTLVQPAQRQNQGGGDWTWGAHGLNWLGKAPVTTSRYLTFQPGTTTTIKKIYGFDMNSITMECAYGGDGIQMTDWFHVSNTISTYCMVTKVAMRSYCDNPNDNFEINHT